jgi:hypothetical protein
MAVSDAQFDALRARVKELERKIILAPVTTVADAEQQAAGQPVKGINQSGELRVWVDATP